MALVKLIVMTQTVPNKRGVRFCVGVRKLAHSLSLCCARNLSTRPAIFVARVLSLSLPCSMFSDPHPPPPPLRLTHSACGQGQLQQSAVIIKK